MLKWYSSGPITPAEQNKQHIWAQLFKTNNVVSKRFVKISNMNMTNTLLFFVDKMYDYYTEFKVFVSQLYRSASKIILSLNVEK